MIKLIIAGSRSLHPTPEEIDAVFDDLLFIAADVSLVISGKAPGADRAGEEWAKARGKPIEGYPIIGADTVPFGRKLAPKMRNRRMAEVGDMAIVFWDGISGGSADMVTRMVARDKPVRVVPMKARKT